MENTKINVLGTEYRVEIHKISDDNYLEKNRLAGYCGEESKLIVIADMSEKKYFPCMDEKEQETYRKKTLRHEIMHAFLNESGWLIGSQFSLRRFLRCIKNLEFWSRPFISSILLLQRRMGHYREFRLMRLELPKRCKVKLIDRRGKHYDL